MVRSMYAAIAGLRAHQNKMDVIGNNIANCNTAAFKSSRATFQEAMYQTTSHSSDGTRIFGGTNASQIGYGSKLASVDIMYSSSNFMPTSSATDCMLDGEGFFVVGQKFADFGGAEDGGGNDNDENNNTIAYGKDESVSIELGNMEAQGGGTVPDHDLSVLTLTRNGSFTIKGDGYLTDTNGNVVYGFTPNADDADAGAAATADIDTSVLRPIRVPTKEVDGKQVPLRLENVGIGEDGTVTGKDMDTKEVITLGKIAVVTVQNPGGLEKTQGPYYQMIANTGVVKAVEAKEGTSTKINSGGLEMANVDLANEFSEMITTQRGFQANAKIITVTDQMLEELVNLKR